MKSVCGASNRYERTQMLCSPSHWLFWFVYDCWDPVNCIDLLQLFSRCCSMKPNWITSALTCLLDNSKVGNTNEPEKMTWNVYKWCPKYRRWYGSGKKIKKIRAKRIFRLTAHSHVSANLSARCPSFSSSSSLHCGPEVVVSDAAMHGRGGVQGSSRPHRMELQHGQQSQDHKGLCPPDKKKKEEEEKTSHLHA